MGPPDTSQPLSGEFAAGDGRAWLDCAHQGPLPASARRAAERALDDKAAPSRMDDAAFDEVPAALRAALARLAGADPADVVLGNSTTYGLNLIAQGFPWRAGDEVLLVHGDFPATVYPWLPLERDGVRLTMVNPVGLVPTAEEIDAPITPRTRLVCVSWVFSFTGAAVDLAAVGQVCGDRGVKLVVNGSQAVGARPLDVEAMSVDALVSCGFKWLCGPYATGFAWIAPELRAQLRNRQAYWLTHLEGGLDHMLDYTLKADLGAAGFDVFCTANFLNFLPWTASIELIAGLSVDRIAEHDQALVARLIGGLPDAYALLSPAEEPARSTLVYLNHRDTSRNPAIHAALAEAGIDVALREGSLRLSPHLYNADADVDRALDVLAAEA